MKYVIAYDIGTTGVKTCIFSIDEKINLISGASAGYPLYTLPNGGAEQEPNDWWQGMVETTKKVLKDSKLKPEDIEGISFCTQMQAVVLVDENGTPVRRSMSYMDQRATEEVKKGMSYGLQIAGANIFKLLPSLRITGAVTSSAKDPVWKLKWVEAHEPENFAKAKQWLDVKEYLLHRCTGKFCMTEDSAFATLIMDNRPGKMCWSDKMCKMLKIKKELLPPIVKSIDCVGGLTAEAASELGLAEGTKVFGGGGDSSLIGVGAGTTSVGDCHIYCGTSGWVNTVVDKRMVDTSAMIAASCGAQSGRFNYFAEMETAGKCFEWVRDHLVADEIKAYDKYVKDENNYEEARKDLYNYMNEKIKDVPAGSNGVIFTPWIHGNRCPFEDPNATGMFFGLKINTGKTEMIRSVLEGIYYHLRWMYECQCKKVKGLKEAPSVRFVGGGALNPVSCQILADVLGKKVETVENPQNVGAVGAAAVCGVGLGLISDFEKVKEFIPVNATYEPNMENHKEYDRYFPIFKKLHKSNKKNYKELSDAVAKKEKKDSTKIQALKFFLFSCSAGLIELLFDVVIFTNIFNAISPDAPWIKSVSYLIGLVASVIWNFTFNRKFTFKDANNIPKAMALAFLFYLFFTPAAELLTGFLSTGDVLNLFNMKDWGVTPLNWDVDGSPMGKDLGGLLITFIVMFCNMTLEFPWQKFVVFRKKKAKPEVALETKAEETPAPVEEAKPVEEVKTEEPAPTEEKVEEKKSSSKPAAKKPAAKKKK